MFKLIFAGLLTANSPVGLAASATPVPRVVGEWRNPADTVHVAMRPCGPSLCGVITWASDEAKADAAAMGADSLVGVELFRDLVADGRDHWSGEVFVPDLGRTVTGTLAQLDAVTLQVEGCVIPGLVCQSQLWTRVAPHRQGVIPADENGHGGRRPFPG